MFENNNEAAEILRRRTSKILGGGVSEKMFLDSFVRPNNIPFSKGWWLSMTDDRLFFFAVKNEFSELDNTIRQILSDHSYNVYQIIFRENDCVIADSEGNNKTIEEFLGDLDIQTLPDRDSTRQEGELIDRCIDFYQREGLLTEEARSIYIEDKLLNRYFYSTNIDLFIENPDTHAVVSVEIKFKNEFLNDNQLVFGEDRLQYETLFPTLRNCGIEVYNCVMYNYLKDDRNIDTTEVFNFLDNCGGNICWKKKLIAGGENHPTYSFNARNTAFFHNEGRTVYCIPLAEYTSIGDSFFEDARDNHWGPCQRAGCTGYRVIRKQRATGKEFMGCTEFRNH